MSVGRRGFLTSALAGSSAYLVGCNAPGVVAMGDAGSPCPLPTPSTPPPLDYPTDAYFAQISSDLAAASIGTPIVFVDMDRLDANVDEIARAVGAGRYRIVEKSLPSLDLLSYVSARSASTKFLVLHLPFLSPLLDAIPGAEVLVGKTHLTSAVRAFFAAQPAGTDLAAIAARVTFLAADVARLEELVALAGTLGVTLRIAIELDVGLRRSGLASPADLPPMLDVFQRASVPARFAGFLGYDGHVAFTPAGTLEAVNAAWRDATAAYQSFVDVLDARYAALRTPDLVMNSGGSSTYPMYVPGTTPVNDVAAGGGVLRPGDYPDYVISALKPAIFIATPVLGQYDAPQLPFFSATQSARIFGDRQGLTIYGGGWPALYTHPPDIQPAPFVSDTADPAMVPNQGMVTAPATTTLRPGDWIFYHPRQSDALFQFDRIHQVRAGRLQAETMSAYPRRY